MSGCHLLQMYRRIPFPGTSPPVLSLVIFIRVLSGRNYFVCFAIFYMEKIYKPAVEQKSSGMEWHYLWIIPCTFYLMWNYTIYGNASRSSLESAMRPGNSFIFFRAGTYIWDHLLCFRFGSKTYFYFRDRFIHSIWKSSGKCYRCLQCTIW